MKTIKVGFSTPKTWKPFAKLIMWAYNIPYDHVYIRLHAASYDRDLIYQASGLMVNFMGDNVWGSENRVIAEFDVTMTDENYVAMMQFAIDSAGTPYGIKDVFGLAYVRIMEICGKTVKNPFKADGSTYVCSELVAKVLLQYCADHFEKDLEDLTPLDVYNLMVSMAGSVGGSDSGQKA